MRYMAWHSMKPHMGKDFPSLHEFLGLKAPTPEPQTAQTIASIMKLYGANGLIKRTYPPGYDGPR